MKDRDIQKSVIDAMSGFLYDVDKVRDKLISMKEKAEHVVSYGDARSARQFAGKLKGIEQIQDIMDNEIES